MAPRVFRLPVVASRELSAEEHAAPEAVQRAGGTLSADELEGALREAHGDA
jgi:hypothetical protein